jgi:hypothetical protein
MGEFSIGIRRRVIAERGLAVICKRDEQLGVGSYCFGFCKKCRVKCFSPRVIELVARRQAIQGPLQQGFGIFDLREITRGISSGDP